MLRRVDNNSHTPLWLLLWVFFFLVSSIYIPRTRYRCGSDKYRKIRLDTKLVSHLRDLFSDASRTG